MEIAIVYESLFGNTRAIAEAIAEGMRNADPEAGVTVMSVAEATRDKLAEVDLLVVGGPTHILRMTSPRTRTMGLQSAEKAPAPGMRQPALEPGAAGPGVREWLAALPTASKRRQAAAFDTRLSYPLAGGAARTIARSLRRHGYRVDARPQGFIVQEAQGPLREGEADRARTWAAGLVSQRGVRPAARSGGE